jgi:hypothetical protein
MVNLFIRTILFFTIFCQKCDFGLASLLIKEDQENKISKITLKKTRVRTTPSRGKVILKDRANLSTGKIEIKQAKRKLKFSDQPLEKENFDQFEQSNDSHFKMILSSRKRTTLKPRIPHPGKNFPPLPVELAPSSDELSSTPPCFRSHLYDCAPWMYSGTRQQWAKAKIDYPTIAFSPKKKKKQVSTEHFSPPQKFHIDLDRQGFSRQNYRLLHQGIKPLLDYYEICKRQLEKPNLMKAQEIFNNTCKHSYDFYYEIDGQHFYVNSAQLNIEASIASLTKKRNPIFKVDFGENSEYHHLFMGHLLALGKEVIILTPAELHRDNHELLHQFLVPGQPSLVRPDGDGLLFSQARQKINQLLLAYLLSKVEK